MTQEEKAKTYDEALKRAKAAISIAADKDLVGGVVRTIFPELRESEDERIRMALIEGVRQIRCKGDVTQEQMLAYLERQKERGPLTKEEEYTLNRIIEYLEDETCPSEWISLLHDIYCLPYGKQKEPENTSASVMIPSCWTEKQKEQKPVAAEDMPYITDEHFYEREPVDSFKYKLAEYMTRSCTKKEGPYGYEYGISAETILKMAEEELLKRGVVQKPAQTVDEKEYVRTLKGLVSDFIRDSGGGITDVEYYQNICDWLDGRHIEQEPAEYLSKDKVYAIMNKLTELSTSELIPLNSDEYGWIHKITEDVRSLLDYPIEQKPAEWDDYTKTNLGRAIQIIKDARGTLHGYQTDDGIYECDKAIEALEHFLYRGLEIEKSAEWSEEDDWKRKELIQYLEEKGDYRTVWMTWLKSLRPQSKQKQNDYITPHKEFFKFIYDRLINVHKENPNVDYMRSFKERLNNLSFGEKQEWGEEDEKMLENIRYALRYAYFNSVIDEQTTEYVMDWLESLRPQPHKEIYQATKHDLAIKFMNYLDENRPEGKMSLSNAECEDIDKAFKENDWNKIFRYIEKYGRRN